MRLKRNTKYLVVVCIWCLICLIVACALVFAKNRRGLKKTNVVFTSNAVIASLVRAVVGDVFVVKVVERSSGDFHNSPISASTAEGVKGARAVLFGSRYEEPSLWNMLRKNDIDSIDIVGDVDFLGKIYDRYYLNKKAENEISRDIFLSQPDNVDGHFWLSPVAMGYALEVVLKWASATAPEKRNFFVKRYQDSRREIDALHRLATSILGGCHAPVFGSHAAYFYLTKDYGIDYRGEIVDYANQTAIPSVATAMLSAAKKQKICVFFDLIEESTLMQRARQR